MFIVLLWKKNFRQIQQLNNYSTYRTSKSQLQ